MQMEQLGLKRHCYFSLDFPILNMHHNYDCVVVLDLHRMYTCICNAFRAGGPEQIFHTHTSKIYDNVDRRMHIVHHIQQN